MSYPRYFLKTNGVNEMSERRADTIIKGLTLDEAEEFVYWFNAEGAVEFSSWLADTLKEEGKEEKEP